MDNTEDVHLLTLILMYALDLNIKQRMWVDFHTNRLLYMLSKSLLVLQLDRLPLLAESFVIGVLLNLVEESEILEVVKTTSLRSNELGQTWIGLVQPSARSDSIGNIGKAVDTKDLDKVLEDCGLDQIRVQLSHTVDLVRTNNSQVSHADHLWVRLLNDGHAAKKLAIIRELALHSLQEEEIDLVDDLKMSWQEVLEKRNGPLLKCLRKDGVVGVSEGRGNYRPCLIPLETLKINEDTLKLDNGKSWVGIVELNSDLIWKLLPDALALLETTDNVVQRCGNPEVLLLKTELLSTFKVVVWIQDSRDSLGALLLGNGTLIVTRVKLLEVELPGCSLGGPQSQVVGRLCSETWDRHIVGSSLNHLSTFPCGMSLAVVILPLADVSIKLDIHNDIVSWELPWVEVEPVIWNLDLVAVNDLLLEDTVSVAETVTPSWVIEGSKGVEEAGGETTKTTITESGIVLLVNDILDSEAKFGKTLCQIVSIPSSLCQRIELTLSHILQPNIQHGIIQRSPHQELQTQIVHPLTIRKGLSLLGVVPVGDQSVSESERSSSVCSGLVAVEHGASQGGLDMADDLLFEVFFCAEWTGADRLPLFALWLRDGCCSYYR